MGKISTACGTDGTKEHAVKGHLNHRMGKVPLSHIAVVVLMVAVGVHTGYAADASITWRIGSKAFPGPDYVRRAIHLLGPMLIVYLLVAYVPRLHVTWRIVGILIGFLSWCIASEVWAFSTAQWRERAGWCAIRIVMTVAFVYIHAREQRAHDAAA